MIAGKLLTEDLDTECQLITENVNGEKQHYIQGVFMQAEKKNRNGRVYPRELLEREVNRYNTNYIRKNRAFGEMGHPESPSINLDRVSHLVTELYPDGADFIGKAKILDTPFGKIVKNLLDGGGQLGVSTRGVGSLKPSNGLQLVQPDFYLACIDIVADPSAPDAFVQGIMEEKEWIYDNGNWTEKDYEKARNAIREANREDVETIALKLFENYMSKLKVL